MVTSLWVVHCCCCTTLCIVSVSRYAYVIVTKDLWMFGTDSEGNVQHWLQLGLA